MAAAHENKRSFLVSTRDLRSLAALTSSSADVMRRILDDSGLPVDLFAGDHDGTLDLADYFRILERLSLEVQDETCRLSSRPLIPGSTHFVWSGVAGAADLLEAMKRVAHAYNLLHGGHYNHVEVREDALVYIIDDQGFPYSARDDERYIHFTMECVLAFLQGMLILVAGDGLAGHLRKVWSRRLRPARHGGQLDFLAVPIRWNAPHYALVYDLRAARMPVEAAAGDLPAHTAVYRKLVDLIEAQQSGSRLRRSVAERVADLLDHGVHDQGQIARRLGLSVATLRRRLHEQGQSFRALRRQALDEAAKLLLLERQHIGQIAETLGFSDSRSFNRAFKAWNGRTPRAYLDARPDGGGRSGAANSPPAGAETEPRAHAGASPSPRRRHRP